MGEVLGRRPPADHEVLGFHCVMTGLRRLADAILNSAYSKLDVLSKLE